jgi:hypothetical protein
VCGGGFGHGYFAREQVSVRERGLLLKFTLLPPPFGRAAGLVCIFELRRHVCRKEIKAKMGFWSMKTRNLILIQRREGNFRGGSFDFKR